MKQLINDYARVMILAKEEALKLVNEPDNGSCNLDTVVIELPRWTEVQVKNLSEKTGLSIGSKMKYGNRFVFIPQSGQGNQRTKMAERFESVMIENGISCSVSYQLD